MKGMSHKFHAIISPVLKGTPGNPLVVILV